MNIKYETATLSLQEGPGGSVVGGIEAVKDAVAAYTKRLAEIYGRNGPDAVQLVWFTSLKHPFIHRKIVHVMLPADEPE